MSTRLTRLLGDVPRAQEWSQETRALLRGVLIAVLTGGILFTVIAPLVAPSALWVAVTGGLLTVAGAMVMLALLRRVHVRVVSWALVVSAALGLTAVVAFSGGLRSGAEGGYLLLVAVSSLLLGWPGAIVGGLLCAASIVGLYLAASGSLMGLARSSVTGMDLSLLLGSIAATAVIVGVERHRWGLRTGSAQQSADAIAAEAEALRSLNASLARRAALLQALSAVSSDIVTITDPALLAERAPDRVRAEFGLSGVELYLPTGARGDGREGADLQSPAAGAELREGFAGECVSSGEAQPATDAEMAELRRLGVQSAHALPLRVDGQVLGALVVHSDEPAFFGEDHLSVLQTAADEVGGCLLNARNYQHARDSAALSERVVRRYVQESWDRLVETDPKVTAYRYLSRWGESAPPTDAWLPGMDEAVRQQQVIAQDEGTDGAVLAIPLVQNGVVIGVMGLRRAPGAEWDADEQILVRTVSEHMTQALENRRLFEAARARAQQEMLLRRTTGRIRTQPDLAAALQVAAEEMRRIVGASEVSIRLGTAEALREQGQDVAVSGITGDPGHIVG